MQHDLTQGPITKTMLAFAAPMIAGNLLQPCYNIADTLIVGQFLGAGDRGAGTPLEKAHKKGEPIAIFIRENND